MAVPKDPELRKLLDQFVCVRTVQMWGLDLDKYQFDGFLTWAIFFLNGDGTIYGRYGSRSESGHDAASDKLISVEGFKKTLQRATRLHREYTENPQQVGRTLAAKTGPKPKWRYAQRIPEMQEMFRTNAPFAENGNRRCIHCHMVPRAEVAALHRLRQRIPERTFWHYPLPRAIGMEMDRDEVATISRIRPETAASEAGLRVSDRIESINGQPILSTADIQWILHHARNPDTLTMVIERAGQQKTVRVPLVKGWRLNVNDWRYLNQVMQGYLVNFRAQPAKPATRKRIGIAKGALAFEVSWVNQWRNRQKSPLQDGDVIIGIDGKRESLSLGTFTARLFQRPPGQTVRLTVIREGRSIELETNIP